MPHSTQCLEALVIGGFRDSQSDVIFALAYLWPSMVRPTLWNRWGVLTNRNGQEWASITGMYLQIHPKIHVLSVLDKKFWLSTGLRLGGRTPYITSKNRLRMPKLHIKDVPRNSENSLVWPKMDIETSCLQKNPAHIYQIT